MPYLSAQCDHFHHFTLAQIPMNRIGWVGMDKSLGMKRLIDRLTKAQVTLDWPIQLPAEGDLAVYIRVSLQDGHVAWSSRICVNQRQPNHP